MVLRGTYNFGRKMAEKFNLVGANRKPSIEAARFIACLFVIFIHQPNTAFGSHEEFIEALRVSARWAVPFFFVASGYFVSKGDLSLYTCRKFTFRLLVLLLFWGAIYSSIYGRWDVSIEAISGGVKSIFTLFNYGFGSFHLWFLFSLLGAGVLYFFGAIIVGVWPLYAIGVAVFLLGIILGPHYYLFGGERSFAHYNTRFFPFFSVPFFLAGVAASQFEFWFVKNRAKFLVLSLAFLLAEYSVFYFLYGLRLDSIEYSLFWLPVSVSLFMWIKEMSLDFGRFNHLARVLGSLSFGIYAMHILVMDFLYLLWMPGSLIGGLTSAMLILALSTIVSLMGRRLPFLRKVF